MFLTSRRTSTHLVRHVVVAVAYRNGRPLVFAKVVFFMVVFSMVVFAKAVFPMVFAKVVFSMAAYAKVVSAKVARPPGRLVIPLRTAKAVLLVTVTRTVAQAPVNTPAEVVSARVLRPIPPRGARFQLNGFKPHSWLPTMLLTKLYC